MSSIERLSHIQLTARRPYLSKVCSPVPSSPDRILIVRGLGSRRLNHRDRPADLSSLWLFILEREVANMLKLRPSTLRPYRRAISDRWTCRRGGLFPSHSSSTGPIHRCSRCSFPVFFLDHPGRRRCSLYSCLPDHDYALHLTIITIVIHTDLVITIITYFPITLVALPYQLPLLTCGTTTAMKVDFDFIIATTSTITIVFELGSYPLPIGFLSFDPELWHVLIFHNV